MRSFITALLMCSCLTACKGSEPQPEAAPPAPVQRAWPQTFMQPAVLIAREVTIEGPEGLREHLALRIDPNFHDYQVSTVPEGLLQELTLKPGVEGAALRCYLDQLEIAAEVRLRVLERPGHAAVRVIAVGEAFYQKPGEPEQRGEVLRLGESAPR